MNRWLLYQDVSCRLWARAGYYQPGGAFGFRDQLQDVLALLLARPDLAREHSAARRRPAVRRRRRPALVARAERPRPAHALLRRSALAAVRRRRDYVRATGDAGVLDERVPFLEAPLLAAGRARGLRPAARVRRDGHALRALRARDRQGPDRRRPRPAAHRQRRLERRHEPRRPRRAAARAPGSASSSTRVLSDFAPLCDGARRRARAPSATARGARASAAQLEQAWDGEWYRRGYYDDGTPLGSAQNDECRIDSIAQSWAVLSGAVPRALRRARAWTPCART